MLDKLIALKDGAVRKLATSILLKALDGHKTNLARAFQGFNMIVAALYLLAPVVDHYAGTSLGTSMDSLNAKYLLVLQFLGSLGLEVGLSDKAAKERAGK